jgi:hypothetical protein
LKGAEPDIQKADTAGGVTGCNRWRFLTCGFDDQSLHRQVRLEHAPHNEKLYGNRLLGGIQATGNSNAIRAS